MPKSPLHKFMAEEWDKFLTIQAECYAPGNSNCMECIYALEPTCCACLFCQVFDYNCEECMPGGNPKSEFRLERCMEIPDVERVDRAIARLTEAGIFKNA